MFDLYFITFLSICVLNLLSSVNGQCQAGSSKIPINANQLTIFGENNNPSYDPAAYKTNVVDGSTADMCPSCVGCQFN
jgi:hypothetical protein